MQKFRDEWANERVRDMERELELRKAQGASELEISNREIEILRKRLDYAKEVVSETAAAIGQADRYAAALTHRKTLPMKLILRLFGTTFY